MSDPEIMLNLYLRNNVEYFKQLNGAFSCVILDPNKNQVILAKDPLGIKPLFYTIQNNVLIFSTEIKGILAFPNMQAVVSKDELCEIFGLGPAHTPGKTFFKGIYEIKPGNFAIYTKGLLSEKCYWDLETNINNDTLEETILKAKALLNTSYKRQVAKKNNVCAMLSGGLDSSVLCALAKKDNKNLTTFSINFEGNDNDFTSTNYQPTKDSDYVKIASEFLNTNHKNIYLNSKDLLDNLKEAVIAKDMPAMADIDSSMLVFCKKIKEAGYDFCISGECSDEIFGGYPWYYKKELIDSELFPWARSFNVRQNILKKDIVSSAYLKKYIKQSYDKTAENIVYNSTEPFENVYRKTCYLTVKWFMSTLVERTERLSKYANLTVLTPFADKELFEYIYNVSAKYKLGLQDYNTAATEKYVLREAFKNELPEDIVYRKKSPFPKTYNPEYLELLENEIKRIITSSTAPILQLLDMKYLFEMLNSHGENLTENWFGQLMTYPQTLAYLIQINIWLEKYNVILDI